MMKPDATELPRISEDKRAFGLIKHEMVMFVRLKIPGLRANLAGHAEMNPEPVMAREFEEHPFAARLRPQKFFVDQSSRQVAGV